ncbi:hypothetical protein MNB_SUP05-SYMBIONT-7-58 [hydrothermal vent metagenome]|uniref:LPS-assembly lipoprotein LptE n=1 Tax=hydrothermal vent metagenome TaxID=652676 RepID=A0A1W1E352_9ZZZZ
MLKINLLAVVISALLGACGFRVPADVASLNVSITGDTNSAFVVALKRYVKVGTVQSLTVQIGDEVRKQQTVAYSAGVVRSYSLTLGVPVKIFRREALLLSKTLTESITVSELSSQADRLQIDASYAQLRKGIVMKLLRRLKALNAN